jgi:hypothetical protein
MTHLKYLIIFHLKVIVCQNVNLPHTYGHCPQNTHLWYDNYQTLHMAQKLIPIIGIIMFKKYYKFYKDQKSFQPFFEYVCIF